MNVLNLRLNGLHRHHANRQFSLSIYIQRHIQNMQCQHYNFNDLQNGANPRPNTYIYISCDFTGSRSEIDDAVRSQCPSNTSAHLKTPPVL